MVKTKIDSIDVNLLYVRYNEIYSDLYYMSDDELDLIEVEYDSAIGSFEGLFEVYPQFISKYSEFVKLKRDIITSDREAVAFMFALAGGIKEIDLNKIFNSKEAMEEMKEEKINFIRGELTALAKKAYKHIEELIPIENSSNDDIYYVQVIYDDGSSGKVNVEYDNLLAIAYNVLKFII